MKSIQKVMSAMAIAILMVSCGGNQAKQETTGDVSATAADLVEVVINVDGMTCTGCENAIKAGVENLEGIASVESSFEEGWTKVKYDPDKTSVEQIEGKITDTGYTVVGEKEGT